MGAGKWPGVAASFLMPQEVFPVWRPGTREPVSPNRAISCLLPILRDVNSTLGWNIWLDQFGISEAELPPGSYEFHRCRSLCLEAAMTGQGVMLAWQTLAHDALVSGRLVAPFPERAATRPRLLAGDLCDKAKALKSPRLRALDRRGSSPGKSAALKRAARRNLCPLLGQLAGVTTRWATDQSLKQGKRHGQIRVIIIVP